MKFPIIANAFGHPKVILEIKGNATGVVEQRRSSRFHRRFPVSAAAIGRPLQQSAIRLHS